MPDLTVEIVIFLPIPNIDKRIKTAECQENQDDGIYDFKRFAAKTLAFYHNFCPP